MMQTLSLKVRADEDGILRLEIPTQLKNQELELVLVMQAIPDTAIDAMGYPLGYFDDTYGSFADDPLERMQPSQADKRDELE